MARERRPKNAMPLWDPSTSRPTLDFPKEPSRKPKRRRAWQPSDQDRGRAGDHVRPSVVGSIASLRPKFGGLMSYGQEGPDVPRRSALFVTKILRGHQTLKDAGRAADQVPAHSQSQNRESARSHRVKELFHLCR